MDTFITWQYLASFTGCVAVSGFIVQATKELPKIKNIPTKYYACIVAFINILICSIVLGTFKFQDLYLILINGLMIGFASIGAYDFSKGKKDMTTNENKVIKDRQAEK